MIRQRVRFVMMCCVVLALTVGAANCASAQCLSCPATYAAPVATYSAYYSPSVVTAYSPVVSAPTYSYATSYATSYAAVTRYRPILGGWTTRLVPYATYRPVYASPVSYTSAYAPCASCTQTVGYAAYSPVTYSAYSPVVYSAYSPVVYSAYSPVVDCSPCAVGCAPACAPCVAPAACPPCATCPSPPATAPAPYGGGNSGTPQSTFQRETQKPETAPEPTPAQPQSMPVPSSVTPSGRVASRPGVVATPVVLTSARVAVASATDDGGWHASAD